jgi:hypothetical protein
LAGLHNTLRRLVVGGAPLVTGLHAIGDSVCTTNPTLGRGLSLALQGAVDLLEVIGQHGHDLTAQALALDRLVASHVAPYYEDQAVIDQARLAMLRHAIFGAPAPDPQPVSSGRVSFAQLRAAAPFDPAVFRAFWKIMGMICPPAQVYTDPHVVARTQHVLSRRRAGPPMVQPTREQLLAALSGSTCVASGSHQDAERPLRTGAGRLPAVSWRGARPYVS